jgi:hypothetical protein
MFVYRNRQEIIFKNLMKKILYTFIDITKRFLTILYDTWAYSTIGTTDRAMSELGWVIIWNMGTRYRGKDSESTSSCSLDLVTSLAVRENSHRGVFIPKSISEISVATNVNDYLFRPTEYIQKLKSCCCSRENFL